MVKAPNWLKLLYNSTPWSYPNLVLIEIKFKFSVSPFLFILSLFFSHFTLRRSANSIFSPFITLDLHVFFLSLVSLILGHSVSLFPLCLLSYVSLPICFLCQCPRCLPFCSVCLIWLDGLWSSLFLCLWSSSMLSLNVSQFLGLAEYAFSLKIFSRFSLYFKSFSAGCCPLHFAALYPAIYSWLRTFSFLIHCFIPCPKHSLICIIGCPWLYSFWALFSIMYLRRPMSVC